jgi:hypothetical protein
MPICKKIPLPNIHNSTICSTKAYVGIMAGKCKVPMGW